MINLPRTSYLLIMLIFFQSFSAVADTLSFHVVDTEHLQQTHQHSDDRKLLENDSSMADTASSDKHNPADCHHCGHCHGSHIQWVGGSLDNALHQFLQAHHFNYLDVIVDAPTNRLLRPPKV